MIKIFIFTIFLWGTSSIKMEFEHHHKHHGDEEGPYFEGDIIDIAPSLLLQGRSGLRDEGARWPNATIPYEFDIGYPSTWQDSFLEATKYISSRTCIKFVPRTDQTDFIKVISGKGCSAAVGRMIGGQIVSLPENCIYMGVIVHELMHSIGFFHEQSRTDRDLFVQIHLENVLPESQHNFNMYPKHLITSFGIEYDYDSLMHYGTDYFSMNGKDTITTIPPGIPIGQREGMSPKDVLKVNTMYKCDMIE